MNIAERKIVKAKIVIGLIVALEMFLINTEWAFALYNPGFEEGTVGWFTGVDRGEYVFLVDEKEAHTGVKSGKIICKKPGLGRWAQFEAVQKGKKYSLSVWVKASGKVNGVLCIYQGSNKSHTRNSMTKFGDTKGRWTNYVIPEITAVSNTMLIFLEHQGGGTVWFDDVELIKKE